MLTRYVGCVECLMVCRKEEEVVMVWLGREEECPRVVFYIHPRRGELANEDGMEDGMVNLLCLASAGDFDLSLTSEVHVTLCIDRPGPFCC